MIVVADTTPLNYLILLGRAELLPQIYGGVLVPAAVLSEMRHAGAPGVVRTWATKPPSWLREMKVIHFDPTLPADLGLGEREAISLALEIDADVLLIDERLGRREARKRHLSVQGTLFVLLEAALNGQLELPFEIDRLRHLGCYIAPTLEMDVLARFAQQKQER